MDEKIYLTERDRGLSAGDVAAIMSAQNRGSDLWPLMANGGMNNGMWNNPFVYLVWMMFAGRFFNNGEWGGQAQQNVEVQSQLQAIRSQMQDNQNSNLLMDAIKGNATAIGQLASNLNCDFNTLNSAICDVRGGIDRLSGQVGFSAERVINAVNMGDCNIIQALKDCCCQTQQSILKMGYEQQLATCHQTNELRNGQRDLGQAITQGFSQTAFQAQQDKCEIIRAGQDNTQRIIDTLNGHWRDQQSLEIQDLKFQLSQERQTRMIERMGRNGWGRTSDCGCGCDNGCGY